MKIYVASSWRNEYQQHVVAELRKAGHEVYDFKHPAEGNAGFHWSEIDQNWQNWTTDQYRAALGHSYAQFGFNCDFDAMKAADACVLVLPCGRSAHLEAGWMKGAGNKVIAYIPEGIRIEPELMYGLLDGVTSDIQKLLSWLKPVVDTKFELCKYPEQVLKIGRDFQNKDGFRGAHYDTVKLLCDTIEYQQEQLKTKTEVGDAAKLREVVKKVLDAVKHLSRTHNDDLPEDVRVVLGGIAFDANDALAAPPRNCDKYPHNQALRIWSAEPENPMNGCFDVWLYAPATEKEGGVK